MLSFLVVFSSIICIIFIPIFIYWAIVFLKRIYLSRRYMRAVVRIVSDEDSAHFTDQLLYHYQTERGKYVLLVAILIMEVTGLLSYYPQFVVRN